MNTVANVTASCGTELIIVDEIHNLNQKYRQMAEASDTLKQLSEKCPGTFVYAGVNVESSGLLDGTRGRQISSRLQIMHLRTFDRTSGAKQAWIDLLLAVESSPGLLDQKPGDVLRHERELHKLTGGVIGDRTNSLHMLAFDAGTERLDLDAVFNQESMFRIAFPEIVSLATVLTDLSFASYLLSPRFRMAQQVWALEAAVITIMNSSTSERLHEVSEQIVRRGREAVAVANGMRQNANNRRPAAPEKALGAAA